MSDLSSLLRSRPSPKGDFPSPITSSCSFSLPCAEIFSRRRFSVLQQALCRLSTSSLVPCISNRAGIRRRVDRDSLWLSARSAPASTRHPRRALPCTRIRASSISLHNPPQLRPDAVTVPDGRRQQVGPDRAPLLLRTHLCRGSRLSGSRIAVDKASDKFRTTITKPIVLLYRAKPLLMQALAFAPTDDIQSSLSPTLLGGAHHGTYRMDPRR